MDAVSNFNMMHSE